MSLETRDLVAGYGSLNVLHGLTLAVQPGETLGLLGPNGAGKTTLLRAICGLVKPHEGAVVMDSADITSVSTAHRVRQGLVHVPEGRGLFASLSVDDNLNLGDQGRRRDAPSLPAEEAYELFPTLANRRRQRAGTLSGGEQQMLAIARAMRLRPKYLILDEPSTGLAPMIVDHVLAAVSRIGEQGVGVLLVEQDLRRGFEIADRIVVMSSGRLVLEQAAGSFDFPAIVDAYLHSSDASTESEATA